MVDRTGVSGRFDFVIEYDRDPDNTTFPPKVGGPGLVEALRKKLGLRLQASKAPVDMLVIDSIERPSEN